MNIMKKIVAVMLISLMFVVYGFPYSVYGAELDENKKEVEFTVSKDAEDDKNIVELVDLKENENEKKDNLDLENKNEKIVNSDNEIKESKNKKVEEIKVKNEVRADVETEVGKDAGTEAGNDVTEVDLTALQEVCAKAEAVLQHDNILFYLTEDTVMVLENAYNDACTYMQEEKITEEDTNTYVQNIESALDSLRMRNIIVSGAYQILDLNSDNKLSFVFDLPIEAIVTDNKVNIYINQYKEPVSADDVVVEEENGMTRVTFTDEYVRSLAVARYYMHTFICGDNELTVNTEFTLRLAVKYESMRIDEQLDVVPMNYSAEEISNWKELPKSWTSANEDIAVVDENGIVTGKSVGQTEIRAIHEDGSFDVWIVTVEGTNGIFVTDDFGDYSDGAKQPINWVTVAKSGIDFAVVRYAVNTDNGTPVIVEYAGNTGLAEILELAKENGVKIGIEFKTTAKNKDEAIAEAEFLIESLEQYKDSLDLPIMYNVLQFKDYPVLKAILPDVFVTDADCEDAEKLEQMKPIANEIIISFNEKMVEAGYKTMIYFSSYAGKAFDVDEIHNQGIGLVIYDCDSDDYPTVAPNVSETTSADVWFYAGDKYVEGATNAGGRTWMLLAYNEYTDTLIDEEDYPYGGNEDEVSEETEKSDTLSNEDILTSNSDENIDEEVVEEEVEDASNIALSNYKKEKASDIDNEKSVSVNSDDVVTTGDAPSDEPNANNDIASILWIFCIVALCIAIIAVILKNVKKDQK